jgi:hypothetical protein
MALWGLVIIVLPISIFISLLASVRHAVRDTVVRHPVAAARTFLSVSVALLLGWLFDVPIEWVISGPLR